MRSTGVCVWVCVSAVSLSVAHREAAAAASAASEPVKQPFSLVLVCVLVCSEGKTTCIIYSVCVCVLHRWAELLEIVLYLCGIWLTVIMRRVINPSRAFSASICVVSVMYAMQSGRFVVHLRVSWSHDASLWTSLIPVFVFCGSAMRWVWPARARGLPAWRHSRPWWRDEAWRIYSVVICQNPAI